VQTWLYIGGQFVDGLAGGTIEVINPADGTVLAAVAEARAEDIDRAADAVEEHAAELARLESLDTGHPIRDSYKRVNPGSPFGGVGMSGYGREMGFEAMQEYTQAKSVWINVDGGVPDWYGA
jgi:acyl-CoA reductase-like NAD-dependent aldehyde dehydrogenase